MVWRKGLAELSVAPPHDITDRELSEGWPAGEASPKVLSLIRDSIQVLGDHPVNRERAARGQGPVNAIWLWGQGKKPVLKPFRERYGVSGAMITAVDLMKGLGVTVGFERIDVPGATGYLDTNYEGKVQAALAALERVDLVYLHVEAPDEAAHGGSLEDKIRALEDFDARIVQPVVDGLSRFGSFAVLLLPDHATPLELKTHSNEKVPFAVYRSEGLRGTGNPYNEETAAAAGLTVERGHELMGWFLGGDI
jgi:2,3-bisphosphoglycerate-independent phosphoglycerate mutase